MEVLKSLGKRNKGVGLPLASCCWWPCKAIITACRRPMKLSKSAWTNLGTEASDCRAEQLTRTISILGWRSRRLVSSLYRRDKRSHHSVLADGPPHWKFIRAESTPSESAEGSLPSDRAEQRQLRTGEGWPLTWQESSKLDKGRWGAWEKAACCTHSSFVFTIFSSSFSCLK